MVNPKNTVWVLQVGGFILGVVTTESRAKEIVSEHKERGVLVVTTQHTLDSFGKAVIRYESASPVSIEGRISEPPVYPVPRD